MSTPRLLVAFASHDGQTRRIAAHIAAQMPDWRIDMRNLREQPLPDPATYDRVLVALGIRFGHFPPVAVKALQQQAGALRQHPDAALVGVCLAARKPRFADPARSAYLRGLQGRLNWQPARIAMFAGALRYPRYCWWEQRLMQLVMLVSGGPTDLHTDIEYTDWDAVAQFGNNWAAQWRR